MMSSMQVTCPRCRGAGRLYPPDPIGDDVGEPCPNCREDGYVTLIEVTYLGSDIDGSLFFTTADGEHHTFDSNRHILWLEAD